MPDDSPPSEVACISAHMTTMAVDVARWIWRLASPETDWTEGHVGLVDGQVLGVPEAAGG